MKSKHIKISALSFLVLLLTSFSTIKNTEIEVKESAIEWKGHRIGTTHEGTLNLKTGKLQFENNQLVGGHFVIDMTSITVTDLTEGRKERLENHLKSDDFFTVATYPTSTMIFNKVEKGDTGYMVTADLTIKGITKTEVFNLAVDKNSASTNLKIDRTKYNIKFRSANFFDDLKDRAIYDEFDLAVRLSF